MPLLSVTTNASIKVDSKAMLLKELSELVAQQLGKPEQYVMVKLQHNPDMLFAGSNAPLAYLELKSIGLPEDRTGELSSRLAGAISQTLQVPADRIYIEFADAQRHMWGWNGGTFA